MARIPLIDCDYDFASSDMHFGHGNIIEYCPGRQDLPGVGPHTPGEHISLDAISAMNEALVERWNAVVQPHHKVLIFGDQVMGKRSETLPYLARLNGEKTALIGNHDKPFGKRGEAYLRAVDDFAEVGVDILDDEVIDLDLGEIIVRACHFPYIGDSHNEDRYIDHRPPDDGLVLFHGHVHDEWLVRDMMINVGADVWDYAPVSFAKLKEMALDLWLGNA